MFDNKNIRFTQCTTISIDTLKVRLTEYAISDTARLVVEQPAIIAGCPPPVTFLCETTGGKEVTGSKALMRSTEGTWEFTITPSPQGVFARVLMHVPTYLYGHNLIAVTQSDFLSCLEQIEAELYAEGISCSLKSAWLSRVDLSRNLILDAPFRIYQPVLECLSPKNQMKPQPYFGTGIRWKNGRTEELLVYDAKRKMKAKKRPWPLPWQHVGRVETRLFGKAKCSSVLGMTRLSELCNRYHDVPEVFLAQMIRHLFHTDLPSLPSGKVITQENLTAFLEACRVQDGGRGFNGRALATLGMCRLQEQGLSLKAVKDSFASVQTTDSAVKRAKSWAADIYRTAAGAQRDLATGQSYASLYEELRDKTLA